jgi:tetratricopeptide (TPR) repeat protein
MPKTAPKRTSSIASNIVFCALSAARHPPLARAGRVCDFESMRTAETKERAELEARARADLAAGRWRQARDAFKLLCKLERSTFQPLLVEANVGLARAMLAKGLISDARQVLTYLRTIALPTDVAALEREIAAATAPRRTGEVGPVPIPLVLLLAAGAGSPAERVEWADTLVVAFQPPLTADGSAEAEQVTADLAAIHQALESACGGETARALDLVRPLRRESPFAHWRQFVRAIAAYQTGDGGKAARHFGELPASSVPGRARAAWLLAIGDGRDTAQAGAHEAVLEATAAISGYPGWGRALARADALWRAGKYAQSYRAVRDARPSFPADSLDLTGALSDFYFNSIFSMREPERVRYEEYLDDLYIGGRARRPAEQQRIRRLLALLLAMGLYEEEVGDLRALWDAFLREHARLNGANPALASMAWTWFGDVLSRPSGGSPGPVDPDGAIAALNKSIELDPTNATAHVLLASVYKSLGRVRDHNRLLDVMAARFPNDKGVLVAAGANALERSAFGKAAGHFDRALALDPLDPALPNHAVTARLSLARQHYAKHLVRKGRAELDRAEALAVDSPDNLIRSRWTLAARRGLMETMYGDPAAAAAALDAARAAAPSQAQCAFFVRLAWSFYDRMKPFPPELQSALDRAAQEEPNVNEAVQLASIMGYWAHADNSRVLHTDAEWLRRYIKNAIRTPFTRDEAARLFDQLRSWFDFRKPAQALVKRVLARDGADPLFRLYKDALEPVPSLSLSQCEAILAEARRRGDVAAERLARGRVDAMQAPMRTPASGPFLDEFDATDVDVDPDPPIDVGTMDGGMEEELAALMNILSNVPDDAIDEIRKRRPKGMPARLFDALVEAARAGPPPAPRSGPGADRRQRTRPLPDPNQPDLF